jgi:predicted esterase YcpF (UPF0227 family)
MALSNQDSNENQKYNYLVAGGILGINRPGGYRRGSGETNYNIQMCYDIYKAALKALDKEIAEKRAPIDEVLNFRLSQCDSKRDACINPNPIPLYDPAGDAARNAKCEQEYKECTQTAKDKHIDELGKLSVYYDKQCIIILSQRGDCIRRIQYPTVPPTSTFA